MNRNIQRITRVHWFLGTSINFKDTVVHIDGLNTRENDFLMTGWMNAMYPIDHAWRQRSHNVKQKTVFPHHSLSLTVFRDRCYASFIIAKRCALTIDTATHEISIGCAEFTNA